MFTGLIESKEKVLSLESEGSGKRLRLSALSFGKFSKVGDSVAVNGCCLTIVSANPIACEFQISPESLARTTFAKMKEGQIVNIETALQAGKTLGGHLVSGHIDGVGKIKSISRNPVTKDFWNFEIEFPPGLELYLVEKGSVCIDGVSLTVNDVKSSSFHVTIIPETFEKTVFKDYKVNETVNIEVDQIGKYVVRFLENREKRKHHENLSRS